MLWEHAKAGHPLQGFTDNYIRVELPSTLTAEDNTLTQVQLGAFTENREALTASF